MACLFQPTKEETKKKFFGKNPTIYSISVELNAAEEKFILAKTDSLILMDQNENSPQLAFYCCGHYCSLNKIYSECPLLCVLGLTSLGSFAIDRTRNNIWAVCKDPF